MKYHNISIKEGMWNEKQISKNINEEDMEGVDVKEEREKNEDKEKL